jgi:hypothetical protein
MVMPKKEVDWRLCEHIKMIEHERRGCAVIHTGKGSDFVAICPDRKPTFVEVKKGCGSLTEFQKKTMQEVRKSGLDYKVERCSCSRNVRER